MRTARRIVPVAAGFVILLGVAPAVLGTDLTVNVPVSVSQLDPRVEAVDVTCQGIGTFQSPFAGSGTKRQDVNTATGSFNGTVTVVLANVQGDPAKAFRLLCSLSWFWTTPRGATPVVGPGGGDNVHHVREGAVLRIDRSIPSIP